MARKSSYCWVAARLGVAVGVGVFVGVNVIVGVNVGGTGVFVIVTVGVTTGAFAPQAERMMDRQMQMNKMVLDGWVFIVFSLVTIEPYTWLHYCTMYSSQLTAINHQVSVKYYELFYPASLSFAVATTHYTRPLGMV
jgi:hypothetical protein